MPPKSRTGKRGRRHTTIPSAAEATPIPSAADATPIPSAADATPIPSAAEPSVLASQSPPLVTPPRPAIAPETPISSTHALDDADIQSFASAAEVLPEPSETSPTTSAASLSPSAPETQINTLRPKRRVVKVVRKIVSSKSKTPVTPTLVSEFPALVTPPPPAIASKSPLAAAVPLPPETPAAVEAAEEPLKASAAAGPSSQSLSCPNQSQTNTIPVKKRVVKIFRKVICKIKSKTPAAASAVSPITPTPVAVPSTLVTPPSSAIAYKGPLFAAAPLHHEAHAAVAAEEPTLKSSAADGASSLNLSDTPTQSETNKMPPKRCVVKIFRKVTPKTKSQTLAASAGFITPIPVTVPSIPTSMSPALDTSPSSTIASAKSHRVGWPNENPLVPSVPQPPETLASDVEAVAKPLKNSVPTGASIADARLQTVVVEASAVAPQTDPSGAGEKATKRVRKVVKKIIVKKKISKLASSEKKYLGSALQLAEMTHKETLFSKTGLQNRSSYAEAGVVRQTENAVVEKDARKEQEEKTDAQVENGMEKASHLVQDNEKNPAKEQHDKKGPRRRVIKKIIVKKKIPKKTILVGTADQETLLSKTGFVNPNLDVGIGEVMQIDNHVIKGKDAFSLKKDKKNGCKETGLAVEDLMVGQSEWQKKRKTEIFIGGLSTDAKEEDVRKVFRKAGEIMEVRMMMDGQTGKNKGYAFLRYKDASQAKKAVSDFTKVEICGRLCGAATLERNDTIYLGNIDKNWKTEDVIKLLQGIGIEKIDTVTVMPDLHNANANRGFAFLVLETNKDAYIAYRKLQKKHIFGKHGSIKVAWAKPLNDPDEEEMQKVKSVYVEAIPSSWSDSKLLNFFANFGVIERVVHARDIDSTKRKDFAFVNYATREAAVLCIESLDNAVFSESDSKVPIKVSLAKPMKRSKQSKGSSVSTSTEKEKSNQVQRDMKTVVTYKQNSPEGVTNSTGGTRKTSDELQALREQSAWEHGQVSYGRGPMVQDYSHSMAGAKRPFSLLGEDASSSDVRGYPHLRHDTYPFSSYGAFLHAMPGPSLPYYQHTYPGCLTGFHGLSALPSNFAYHGIPPYAGSMYFGYR